MQCSAVVTLRGFYLDDFRAHVREQAGADRPCHDIGEVEYSYAVQRALGWGRTHSVLHLLNQGVETTITSRPLAYS
jgi:hypothetical protein